MGFRARPSEKIPALCPAAGCLFGKRQDKSETFPDPASGDPYLVHREDNWSGGAVQRGEPCEIVAACPHTSTSPASLVDSLSGGSRCSPCHNASVNGRKHSGETRRPGHTLALTLLTISPREEMRHGNSWLGSAGHWHLARPAVHHAKGRRSYVRGGYRVLVEHRGQGDHDRQEGVAW